MATIRSLAERIHNGAQVVAHCRQGIGRAGLLVCGVLIALGRDVGEAMAVVSEARGREVPETESQRQWLRAQASRISIKDDIR